MLKYSSAAYRGLKKPKATISTNFFDDFAKSRMNGNEGQRQEVNDKG